jgi:hypothetical protein
MHNHRTSSCIVLHKFTAFLAGKTEKILPTNGTSGGNKKKYFVVEESCYFATDRQSAYMGQIIIQQI